MKDRYVSIGETLVSDSRTDVAELSIYEFIYNPFISGFD